MHHVLSALHENKAENNKCKLQLRTGCLIKATHPLQILPAICNQGVDLVGIVSGLVRDSGAKIHRDSFEFRVRSVFSRRAIMNELLM